MPYIPIEHQKYDLLPFCRQHNKEVFDYSSDLLYETGELLGDYAAIMPCNFACYDDYFSLLDKMAEEHSHDPEIVKKLHDLRGAVQKLNQKDEWSVLIYVGPTVDEPFGLTNGKYYYWPTTKEKPIYCGIIDDSEFTSYWYFIDASDWEIAEDPTGMAHRAIFENKGVVFLTFLFNLVLFQRTKLH